MSAEERTTASFPGLRPTVLCLAVLVFLATGGLSAQSHPKELTWALGEFAGGGSWATRLPLLLTRGWDALPPHRLTVSETLELQKLYQDSAVALLEQQVAKQRLEVDRKRLLGTGDAEMAPAKALADLEDKLARARAATSSAAAPESLPWRAVWAPGRDKLPWSHPTDAPSLAARTGAVYAVTGSVRTVEGYLLVEVGLFSQWEHRTLAQWEGRFSPDEAADRMAEASDHLREALLGRPWAGLTLTASRPGALVRVSGAWHPLPWAAEDLVPGVLELTLRQPGRPDEETSVELLPNQRAVVNWSRDQAADPLVLETEPPGVALYLDSRYLGPSPQTVDRPLATARVRAQAPGWETLAWEVGPETVSPSRKTLVPPVPVRSVGASKDRFYAALAAFSVSLTTGAFAGAWAGEQVSLTNAYALKGDVAGYNTAFTRYQLVTAGYAASLVLTSGLFVWMMFELGDYLGTAQASLP